MRHFRATIRQLTTSSTRLLGLILLMTGIAATAQAQTTSFAYQGRLIDAGAPANGPYDLQFGLWDRVIGGAQIGVTQTLLNVNVSNGSFSVTLDFGVAAFPGANRFLEISVRPSGGGSSTLLTPREQITSAPYAIRSLQSTASDALSSACVGCVTSAQVGSVAGSSITGAISVASVTANIVDATTQYNIGGSRLLSIARDQNLFAGIHAGQANTTGSVNTFFGLGAGQANTIGSGNTFLGYQTGLVNVSGFQNTFVGAAAGEANTSGAHNSFFGNAAGLGNTTGSNNSFFGEGAGLENTTGLRNSFFGTNAGEQNSTAADNSFFGANAGSLNTTGNNNSFFGAQAGDANTTGFANAFFGKEAGRSNTTASNNAFFGFQAGQLSTSPQNAFFGASSGQANTTGISNAFFGFEAGKLNVQGQGNSFFGADTGFSTTTGSSNSFFGSGAGSGIGANNIVGSSNTLIGAASGILNTNFTNATAIGANAAVNQSNSLVLGSINGLNGATADTKVGIGTPSPNERLTVQTATSNFGFVHTDGLITVGSYVGGSTAGGWYGTKSNHPLSFFVNNGAPSMTINTNGLVSITTLGLGGSIALCRNPAGNVISVCSSSLRYKTNLALYSRGLEVINRLRPITFDWKEGGMHDVGFGAEDVAKIDPLLVTYNDKGQVEGVKYDRITVALTNAIKQQQTQIEKLESANAAMHTENEALNERLKAVEKLLDKKADSSRRR